MVGNMSEYDLGFGQPRKNNHTPSRSVSTIRPRRNAAAELPRPRPQVSINALDWEGNIKPQEADPLEQAKYLVGRWDGLSSTARDKILEICKKEESLPRSSLKNKNVNPLTSRPLHVNPHVPNSVAKTKVKTAPPKRKALTLEESDDDDDDDDDEEDRSSPTNLRVQIHIAREDEVNHFLQVRFTQIQQLATKVIAKAWIKAICPKKQANYPYVDSNPKEEQRRRRPRYDGPPRIPKFWPVELCRHKEPDHTRKSERTHLLVHLLRLYWGQKEWIESNGTGCEVPNQIKAGGWVAFLKDAFPPSKLDEVQGSNPEKAALRKQYLNQIYRVAQQEEDLRRGNGAITDTTQYSAGPGWVPFGNAILRSSAHRDLSISKEDSGTPSTAICATGRSNSQSDTYGDTPDTNDQGDESRSASPVPEVEFAREGKVEYANPINIYELEEATVAPQDWKPIETPVQKMGHGVQPMVTTAGDMVSVPAGEVGYFEPVWSDGMRSRQAMQTLYNQYASTPSQWFGNAGCEFDQHQQSDFVSTAANGVLDDYRQGFESFPPAMGGIPLQDRLASQQALSQVQFTAGYAETQQMGLSGPLSRAVVTTANDSQNMAYSVSGLRYGDSFGSHSTAGRYPSEQHPNMHRRWS